MVTEMLLLCCSNGLIPGAMSFIALKESELGVIDLRFADLSAAGDRYTSSFRWHVKGSRPAWSSAKTASYSAWQPSWRPPLGIFGFIQFR